LKKFAQQDNCKGCGVPLALRKINVITVVHLIEKILGKTIKDKTKCLDTSEMTEVQNNKNNINI